MNKINKRDLTDAEQRELIASYERGEWMTVSSIEAQRAFSKET